jgi:serine protease Do
MPPGTSVKVTMLHKTGDKWGEKTVSLTLGTLPDEREAKADTDRSQSGGTELSRLGLTLAPAAQVAGSGSEGVVVTDVNPNGLAADHGFKTGDVILEVGGKKVGSPNEVRDSIRDAQKDGKRTVLMRVKSGDGIKFVALRLGRA